MRLNILERLMMQGLLPKESNFVTLRIVNKLREDLSFDEDEIKHLGIEADGDQVRWDPAKGMVVKDVDVGEVATKIIQEALTGLDETSKLTADHLTLYGKFFNA